MRRLPKRQHLQSLVAGVWFFVLVAAAAETAQKSRVFTNEDIGSGKPAGNARSYPLPGHGQFQLKVPGEWKDNVGRPPNDLPPTIGFSEKSGAPFIVLMTPAWQLTEEMGKLTDDEVRRRVSRTAEGAKSQAVEKTLEIKDLAGSSGHGYYFSATDRAPAPGEFKYMTQGILRVADLIVPFTILTNDGQEQVVRDALEALSSATHR